MRGINMAKVKTKKGFNLRISVTEICNLSCNHCYALNRQKSIDFELFKKAVDNVYEIAGEASTICFMGGEPTLYPDIIKAVDYVTNKNMTVNLTTNGYYSDIDKLKTIKKSGKVFLTVSIDGPEEFHNINRGKKDSYEEAIKTLDAISKMQDLVSISLQF